MRKNSTYGRVLQAIRVGDGPMSAADIVKASGASLTAVTQHLVTLHDEELIHIGAWVQNSHGHKLWTKCWSPGEGPDVECPKPPAKRPNQISTKLAKRRKERAVAVPETKFKTMFVGGINPWQPAQTAQKLQ